MTAIEIARLAGAIAMLRPDWPCDSLRTFIAQHFTGRPLRDVAVALAWVAADPDSRTPARVLEAGPWWHAARTADVPGAVNDCPRHELAGLRVDVRTGATTCAGCHADAHEDREPTMRDRGGRPIPDSARRVLETALRASGQATTEPATRPEATG